MNQPDLTASIDVPRPSAWTAGRIAALAMGAVLVLLALALLGGGGAALWADRTQRDGGYVTTDGHEFSSGGSALVTVSTHLGSAGTGWLYSPGLLGKVRIRVTPTRPDRTLFVGIGRTADVDRYLAGVSHTVISDFWDEKTRLVDGDTTPPEPGAHAFWSPPPPAPECRP